MFCTVIGLFCFHRKQRDADREKRLQYWKEQVRLGYTQWGRIAHAITSILERVPSKPQEHARDCSIVDSFSERQECQEYNVQQGGRTADVADLRSKGIWIAKLYGSR